MRGEAGIVQREWAKEYGPTIRAVGPFGISRMMFLGPTAMQKVLVSEWIEYPRVSVDARSGRAISLTFPF